MEIRNGIWTELTTCKFYTEFLSLFILTRQMQIHHSSFNLRML
jgi:hypothetical protein